MFKIDNTIYKQLAEELAQQIQYNRLFAGSISIDTDDADVKFTATLIPHFKTIEFVDDSADVLDDITPVWWEVDTTTLDGKVLNDFDFQTFKEYICQW
ncbi:MAG: hypothetical protein SNH63_01225 [Rikenellaceae bacterium]